MSGASLGAVSCGIENNPSEAPRALSRGSASWEELRDSFGDPRRGAGDDFDAASYDELWGIRVGARPDPPDAEEDTP